MMVLRNLRPGGKEISGKCSTTDKKHRAKTEKSKATVEKSKITVENPTAATTKAKAIPKKVAVSKTKSHHGSKPKVPKTIKIASWNLKNLSLNTDQRSFAKVTTIISTYVKKEKKNPWSVTMI